MKKAKLISQKGAFAYVEETREERWWQSRKKEVEETKQNKPTVGLYGFTHYQRPEWTCFNLQLYL